MSARDRAIVGVQCRRVGSRRRGPTSVRSAAGDRADGDSRATRRARRHPRRVEAARRGCELFVGCDAVVRPRACACQRRQRSRRDGAASVRNWMPCASSVASVAASAAGDVTATSDTIGEATARRFASASCHAIGKSPSGSTRLPARRLLARSRSYNVCIAPSRRSRPRGFVLLPSEPRTTPAHQRDDQEREARPTEGTPSLSHMTARVLIRIWVRIGSRVVGVGEREIRDHAGCGRRDDIWAADGSVGCDRHSRHAGRIGDRWVGAGEHDPSRGGWSACRRTGWPGGPRRSVRARRRACVAARRAERWPRRRLAGSTCFGQDERHIATAGPSRVAALRLGSDAV